MGCASFSSFGLSHVGVGQASSHTFHVYLMYLF